MKNARVLAAVALIAGGVATPVAIQQIAERERMEAAALQAEIEDVTIEAAYALKELGRTPEQVRAELAAASGVDPAQLEALTQRSTLGRDRDPRARRSVDGHVIVATANLAAVTAAWAPAMCAPLAVLPELASSHTQCMASHADPGASPLCEGGAGGAQVGAVISSPLTPSQAARLRAALADSAELSDGQRDARLLALGWWPCDSSPPDQATPVNPNLSNP